MWVDSAWAVLILAPTVSVVDCSWRTRALMAMISRLPDLSPVTGSERWGPVSRRGSRTELAQERHCAVGHDRVCKLQQLDYGGDGEVRLHGVGAEAHV
jgi:hypothetical protein